MVGIYTQKRDLSPQYSPFGVLKSNTPGYPPYSRDIAVNFNVDNEVTTSYRSGYGFSDIDRGTIRELYQARALGAAVKSEFDNGHEFSTEKRTSWTSHKEVFIRGRNSVDYRGPLMPYLWSKQSGLDFVIPKINLQYGARAIQNTTPTKPHANLASALGELALDGLPASISLIQQFARGKGNIKKTLKSDSEVFLGYEFAWRPFVSDVLSILKAVMNSEEIILAFEKNAGGQVRRKFAFDPIITNDYTNYGKVNDDEHRLSGVSPRGDGSVLFNLFPSVNGNNSFEGSYGTVERTITSEETYKFSGAYTYVFPNGDDMASRITGYAQKAQYLLGLRITPEVLWQLTPWSWLVDWMSDIGSIITNATRLSENGLVLRYGYLMRHYKRTVNHTISDIRFNSWTPQSITMSTRVERKERVRATPYGFGLNPSSFSGEQWAILAVLGMTKSPTGLR